MEKVFFLLVPLLMLAERNLANDLDERVFNGYKAYPGQFPYQALLIVNSTEGYQSFCGASLVSSEYVLTAAHCVESVTTTYVHLGVTREEDTNGVVVLEVPMSRTVIHPEYSRKYINNDIAILHLPKPVTFTDRIQPIRLPRKVDANPSTFDRVYAVVSGFGQTYNDEPPTPQENLIYSWVHVMPHKQCKQVVPSPPITDGMICTDRQINAGHCAGDSGGPLQYYNTLIGIVSFGGRPCVNKSPSMYVNVAHYLDWIAENSNIRVQ